MEKQARVVLLGTAALLTVMAWWSWRNRAPEPVPVSAGMAAVHDIYNSVTVPGTVEATESVTVSPIADAVVQQVMVNMGQRVEKGDLLCTLSQADADGEYAEELQNVWRAIKGMAHKNVAANSDIAIYAPQDGTVVSLPAAGQRVFAGLPCVQLAELKQLQIRAEVPELYAGAMACGQQANVTAPAVSGRSYSAVVSSISPVAVRAISLTGASAAATVEAILPLRGSVAALRPGYSVSVKVFTDLHEQAVVVPHEAVCQRGEQEYVFCIEHGKAVQRAVSTGYMLENVVEIVEGLEGDEQVVLSPAESLASGVRVEVAV
ncbi:MAG: efflux RND transporter periplasmic adaptor subunit [Agathobaculum sp.]|jgi:multidrug efflux pump subunit AcrA (membrane-fusion protein)|uniref:efflux RND transporter periplasmic adaptor subunit n=1 Tax=Agathobaculum sp. TaxID=2048138 RepID=UPI003D92FB3A